MTQKKEITCLVCMCNAVTAVTKEKKNELIDIGCNYITNLTAAQYDGLPNLPPLYHPSPPRKTNKKKRNSNLLNGNKSIKKANKINRPQIFNSFFSLVFKQILVNKYILPLITEWRVKKLRPLVPYPQSLKRLAAVKLFIIVAAMASDCFLVYLLILIGLTITG